MRGGRLIRYLVKFVMLFTDSSAMSSCARRAGPRGHEPGERDRVVNSRPAGIYGQRDYNAWIGKVTCDRLGRRLDPDAYAAAKLVHTNLQRGSTTTQAWQSLGAAVQTYCPDLLPVLQSAALPNPAEQPG